MNHLNVLKRSWQILWRYRALWLFGIILAITLSSAPRSSQGLGYSFGEQDLQRVQQAPFSRLNPEEWNSLKEALQALTDAFDYVIPLWFGQALVAVVITLVCLVFILGVLFTILGYVANTALIRMVDEYEQSEEPRSVGHGFRLGWSRASWRIFLIDLLINIPMAILFLLLFLGSLSPLLLWATQNNVAGILGTVAAIGLFFLMILVAIVVGVAVSVVRNFIHRACALQSLGVFDSLRAGFRLFRSNLKDSALMWLILLGIEIAYSLAAGVIAFLLLLPTVVLAGGGALLAGGIGNIFEHTALPWVLAVIVGGMILFLLLGLPLLFLAGLKETYFSTAWTLVYRELTALGAARTAPEALLPGTDLPELPLMDEGEAV